jgi:hypothetical protein
MTTPSVRPRTERAAGIQVQERQTVYVPIILSAAAIGLGLFLLVAFRSK